MGSLRPKYNVWAEKYRGVIFHDTEEWCKIWRKLDLCFEKWQEKFGKFSPEYLKVSKLGLLCPIKLGLLSKVEKVWP